MRHITPWPVFFVATLLVAVHASAQQGRTVPDAPARERWDVDAGLGWFNRHDSDWNTRTPAEPQSDWTTMVYGVDAGYYWTSHLKIDVAGAFPGQYSTFDAEAVPVAGLPDGGSVFTRKTVDFTTFSVAATYQFRENAFAHPYVSGGLQFEWLREHRFRDERVYTFYNPDPVTYTAPALDEHHDHVLMRPFVAAGAKFYFNRRIYVRPEAALSFGDGIQELTYRFAVGADF